MNQLRDLNRANDAYYRDRYGPDSDRFQISSADGMFLKDYFAQKAEHEASVAKNEDDNEWRFLCIVVGIPLA